MAQLTRRKGRIQHVNVHRDVDFASSNSLLQPFDDTVNADTLNFSRLDHFEAAPRVVAQVLVAVENGSPNSRMN